jgi:hypothetical protein
MTPASVVTDDEVGRLTDDEAEATFIALVELLDRLGCAPAATIASKDDEGVSFSLHFSADRARILARAALAASDRDVLVKALQRIEQNWGHCNRCGTPCEGFTDGCCERPSWAPDDPVEIARAALIPLGGET